MKLTKCKNKHFYDADTYAECPHCSGGVVPKETEKESNDGVAAPAKPLHSQVRAVLADTQSDDDSETVAIYDFPSDVEPVVGWLVCVTGEYFGQSFSLKAGENLIGSDLDMDVPLAKDTKVSRNKHAIITFDPKDNKFFLQPRESSAQTHLNGELLLASTEIDAYDRIDVGDSKLVFIPFCSDQFSWKEEEEG